MVFVAQVFENPNVGVVGPGCVGATRLRRLGCCNIFLFFVPAAADEPWPVSTSSSSESEVSTSAPEMQSIT
jgi:hypothetical protein